MPVLLDGVSPDTTAFPWIGAHAGVIGGSLVGVDDDCLEIGLVNNMPDAALQATERQFIHLLAAAAPERTVRVHLFSLPSVARGEMAAAHIAGSYAPLETMGRTPLDALIVTGCEPRAASLVDEPYWDSLTRLIDWAEDHTVSTLWSCLAAHAAVLHLDGIGRHPLPAKRSGVYECAVTAAHRLTEGAPPLLRVPHSRWNDLRESEVAAHGYTVLSRSATAGLDLFAKQWNSLFVFFQGHPEYDVDSLAREYRRDVARFLRGERPLYPGLPDGYFSDATRLVLGDLQTRAERDRRSVALRDLPRRLDLAPGLAETWQASVIPVFRNWIDLLAERRR